MGNSASNISHRITQGDEKSAVVRLEGEDWSASLRLEANGNIIATCDEGHPEVDRLLGRMAGQLQKYIGQPPVIDPPKTLQLFLEKHWNFEK
jgi:hypothetical protein